MKRCIGPVDVLEVTVLFASLPYHYRLAPPKDSGRDDLQTDGTEGWRGRELENLSPKSGIIVSYCIHLRSRILTNPFDNFPYEFNRIQDTQEK